MPELVPFWNCIYEFQILNYTVPTVQFPWVPFRNHIREVPIGTRIGSKIWTKVWNQFGFHMERIFLTVNQWQPQVNYNINIIHKGRRDEAIQFNEISL